MADPNTRQGKRTPVTLKIKFKSETIEQFIERYAVDVSQGGIFIRTKEPLAVGTQMRFEFQLRDASPLIAGEGTVVWTRENDPSRPAIAPGMGVRFDRLAEGSQGVLERILSEKAKQAPPRSHAETTKPPPPMFADTPTRVAPASVQDALFAQDRDDEKRASDRKRSDSFGEAGTPLPKPTPWHSDADEFPEEAFEEATKVRSLDDLVAQTAPEAMQQSDADEVADRRNDRVESTHAEAPEASEPEPEPNRDSVPTLPSPPETAARPQPRLLDTTPSPRSDTSDAPAERAVSKSMPVATEPARASAQELKNAPTKPTGMRAVPTAPKKSGAPIALLLLLLVAIAGAAVWFLVLRKSDETTHQVVKPDQGSATTGSASSGAPIAAGHGGNTDGSGSDTGSGSASVGSGSDVAMTGSAGGGSDSAVKAELVETVITASADKATIEVVGTTEHGPSPLKAKLEKGKTFKARVTAPGYADLEVDVKAGDKVPAKLVAKPRMIAVSSEPPGALIFVDNAATGHSTPFQVELTAAQAAKKSVRVMLRKSGYKQVERVIDASKYSEDAAQMVVKIDERLVVQVPLTPSPTPPTNRPTHTPAAGSNAGSQGSAASGTTTGSAGNGAGSASTPPTGAGSNEPLTDGPKPGTTTEP